MTTEMISLLISLAVAAGTLYTIWNSRRKAPADVKQTESKAMLNIASAADITVQNLYDEIQRQNEQAKLQRQRTQEQQVEIDELKQELLQTRQQQIRTHHEILSLKDVIRRLSAQITAMGGVPMVEVEEILEEITGPQ